MSDKQLILLLKNNPSKGLEAAMDLYGGLVKWVILKIIGDNQEDLEECVSDTFVRLWQSIDRYDLEKNISLKNYLCGIARHIALDYRRKSNKYGEILPIEEVSLDIEIDFVNEISKNMNAEIIQDAINQLPPPDKEIFIYRYYFFEKVPDIAVKLSLDNKTVENKLYRGKQKLRNRLLEGGIII